MGSDLRLKTDWRRPVTQLQVALSVPSGAFLYNIGKKPAPGFNTVAGAHLRCPTSQHHATRGILCMGSRWLTDSHTDIPEITRRLDMLK
jgi:hypothetical protein